MDRLPPEIVQNVFFFIDDFNTLRAVTLTCQYLHAAFTSRERLVATQVLQNQIGWDVLPEAVVVDGSSRLGAYNSRKAQEFSKKHLQRRMTSVGEPARWNAAEALRIVRLHKIVQFLANEIADIAWEFYFDRDHPPNPKPSLQELYRIQRALYRFQLYWNIFGSGSALVEFNEQRDIFFRHFNIWENEQVACVQHHLLHIVQNTCLGRDSNLRGSTRSIGIGNLKPEDDHAQYIFSQGLEYLHEIATSEIFTGTSQFSINVIFFSPVPLMRNNLHDGLKRPRSPHVRWGDKFENLTFEEVSLLIENPYCDGNNCDVMLEKLAETYDEAAYYFEDVDLEDFDYEYFTIESSTLGREFHLDQGYAFWG